MRSFGASTVVAAAAAALLVGCGGNPNEIKRFTPQAMVLATEMHKALTMHSTGEAAGVIHEAERMFKIGQIQLSDYETLRRIEATLRGNDRNTAIRVFETAMGLRQSADETEADKAAEERKTKADAFASSPLADVLGNNPLPVPKKGDK